MAPQSSVIKAISRNKDWLRRSSGRTAKGRVAKLFYLAPGARNHLKAEVLRPSQKLEAILAAIEPQGSLSKW